MQAVAHAGPLGDHLVAGVDRVVRQRPRLFEAGGAVLLEAANAQSTTADPTAHAEIVLIRAAARDLGLVSLGGLTVASNAEPCSMCASALVKARVGTIVFGAPHEPHMDPAIGLADVIARSTHAVNLVGPVLAGECAAAIAGCRERRPAAD